MSVAATCVRHMEFIDDDMCQLACLPSNFVVVGVLTCRWWSVKKYNFSKSVSPAHNMTCIHVYYIYIYMYVYKWKCVRDSVL